jgi:hypothetical protein
VCARHEGVLVARHGREVSLDESVMSALAMSPGAYTWLCWDDSWLLPSGLDRVLAALAAGSPSAVIVGTAAPAPGAEVDPRRPVEPQIAGLLRGVELAGEARFTRAEELFRARFYGLPIPGVIYPTAAVLAADYRRYFGTYHPHIGALYDALAAEQGARGAVDVVELRERCALSLIPLGERGKRSWTALFDDIATRALPAWLRLLPEVYGPDVGAAFAHHEHIFRAALGGAGPQQERRS